MLNYVLVGTIRLVSSFILIKFICINAFIDLLQRSKINLYKDSNK